MPCKSIPPEGVLATRTSAAIAYLQEHPAALGRDIAEALGWYNSIVLTEALRRAMEDPSFPARRLAAQVDDVARRFEARLDHQPSGCWVWPGATSPKGYGHIRVRGEQVSTHRFALERALGRPLLPGMLACHTCDNPPCCNPVHLFEGTHSENSLDMDRKGRRPDSRGSRGSQARLSDDDVRYIREAKDRNVDLARRFSISQATVCDIKKRRTWSHL